jgi:DNA primase
MAATQHEDVEGRRLALTNLNKVLYLGYGFTKAHVIDYYTRVAKWLLLEFGRVTLAVSTRAYQRVAHHATNFTTLT